MSFGRGRKITVAGSVAQRPGNGGHTWVFLQYLLGFKKLGFDVMFLDRLDAAMCVGGDDAANVAYLSKVMQQFGLASQCSLFRERDVAGRSRHDVIDHVAGSELFLNVMGFFNDDQVLARAKRKIFLDIDPGFGQMWRELKLSDLFVGHDRYVTIGENIGRPDCSIPTCGIEWITTPQPIVLDEWPVSREDSGAFTSVASWRGPFGPVEFRGKIYGLRVHEFRRFVELPKRTRRRFEVAMDIHTDETKDVGLLRDNGWSLIDPRKVAADPIAYRRYIQQSHGEFCVAKNMYVQTRGGWFSDRSICYLASGKPVLAQDTGWSDRYPSGEGLLAFSTIDEAIEGVEKIGRDYGRHCQAARAIAEEHFDSDKVLTKLLAKLGVEA